MKSGIVFFSLFVFLAGCNQPPPQSAAPVEEPEEPEPVAVTNWTDRTELFMEYPPLVADGAGRGRSLHGYHNVPGGYRRQGCDSTSAGWPTG